MSEIKKIIKNIEMSIALLYPINTEEMEFLNMALEKQVPRKPFYECDNEFNCIACGVTTEDYDVTTIKFCPECGQKLDWSDDNE